MTSESSAPQSSGGMIRVGQSLPAVEVDCSDWLREPDPRSSGQLVRVGQSLPAIEMEFVREPDVFLELTFTLAPGADANRAFDKVTKLFERVNDYEKSLGGAGIRWNTEGLHDYNGTLHLVLRSNNSVDPEVRLQTLATLVVGTVAEFQIVNSVSARGCRMSEPDRPLFEIEGAAA
jgi:hypothetical protein